MSESRPPAAAEGTGTTSRQAAHAVRKSLLCLYGALFALFVVPFAVSIALSGDLELTTMVIVAVWICIPLAMALLAASLVFGMRSLRASRLALFWLVPGSVLLVLLLVVVLVLISRPELLSQIV